MLQEDRDRGLEIYDTSDALWALVVGPDGVPDYAVPLARVEQLFAALDEQQRQHGISPDARGPRRVRHWCLRLFGALLYRAGRYQEALDRLNEGLALDPSGESWQDWAFLAMAHQRLGKTRDARTWIDKLRAGQGKDSGQLSWDNLEKAILYRQAGALLGAAE